MKYVTLKDKRTGALCVMNEEAARQALLNGTHSLHQFKPFTPKLPEKALPEFTYEERKHDDSIIAMDMAVRASKKVEDMKEPVSEEEIIDDLVQIFLDMGEVECRCERDDTEGNLELLDKVWHKLKAKDFTAHTVQIDVGNYRLINKNVGI